MFVIKELRERKASKTEAMSRMLDAAKRDNRELTRSENTEWSQLERELDAINEELKEAEEQESRNKAEVSRRLGGNPAGTGEAGWIDERSGKPVQVLNNEQRFADALGREERELSMGKYIRGIVTGRWDGAEAEQRFLHSGPASTGIAIPEILVPKILDKAREQSVLSRAGAKVMAMSSNNATILKLKDSPSAEYKAEGALFTAQDATFEPVQLNTHTMGIYLTMSRELFEDATNVVDAIETAFAEGLKEELDAAGLFGSGVNKPRGVYNTTGVQEIAVGGPLVHYNPYVQAWSRVLSEKGNASSYIVSPREAASLEMLADQNGAYLRAPQAIANLNRLISAGVQDGVSFLGDFTNVLYGIRTGSFRIETTTQGGQLFESHSVGMKITARYDVAVINPKHIVKLTGITA